MEFRRACRDLLDRTYLLKVGVSAERPWACQNSGKFNHAHESCTVFPASPDELPAIDIRGL
jgi:hypothetical protein